MCASAKCPECFFTAGFRSSMWPSDSVLRLCSPRDIKFSRHPGLLSLDPLTPVESIMIRPSYIKTKDQISEVSWGGNVLYLWCWPFKELCDAFARDSCARHVYAEAMCLITYTSVYLCVSLTFSFCGIHI